MKERLSRPWSNNAGIAFGVSALCALLAIVSLGVWHVGDHASAVLWFAGACGIAAALSLGAFLRRS